MTGPVQGAAASVHGGLVTLGPGCVQTRRLLDPTAWIVLEDLVMASHSGARGDTVVVSTSVRELASQLGLSKDTVASALRRLGKAGIVRREDDRDGGSGRFGHSRYIVDLTSTGIGLAASTDDARPRASDTVTDQPDHSRESGADDGATRARRQTTRARSATDDAQLSLLDLEPDPA